MYWFIIDSCPWGWKTRNGVCYYSPVEKFLPFDQAEAVCASMGAHLVSIRSRVEQAAVRGNETICWKTFFSFISEIQYKKDGFYSQCKKSIEPWKLIDICSWSNPIENWNIMVRADDIFFSSEYMTAKRLRSVFIGYTDRAREGKWVWTDGNTSSFTLWARWQPDNYNGIQDCVRLTIPNWNGFWDDASCDQRLNFICQIRLVRI